MAECLPVEGEKLKSMLQAHLDGVYVFSHRSNCDELVTALIRAYLHRIRKQTLQGDKSMADEEKGIAEIMEDFVNAKLQPLEQRIATLEAAEQNKHAACAPRKWKDEA